MSSPSAAAVAVTASKGGMRIASFLPAATEMICSLGLGEFLVGRTHECDSPEEAKNKPVLVDCVLNLVRPSVCVFDHGLQRRQRSEVDCE